MSSKPRTVFRPLDGLLLLDKPAAVSSNQALQQARRLFRAEKGGHTGSLDPLATGLLPLCFGEATKIAGLLLGSRKAYETVAVLGVTTDTDDADGQPLRERPVPALRDGDVEAALAPLRGAIVQRAPIYSALKQGGERLYALARKGVAVEAPERPVEVHELRVLERSGDTVRLHVECGSGTYVRSLVRDLGEALGCGAHVVSLRRLWVDPFRLPDTVTLDTLQSEAVGGDPSLARLLPIAAGLAMFPSVHIDDDGARRFRLGQKVAAPSQAIAPEETIAVYGANGQPLGLARFDGSLLQPQRLFVLDSVTA